ncbi:MAG: hypothetical protein ABGX22_26940, partial [Pirellulaceae bacterium]
RRNRELENKTRRQVKRTPGQDDASPMLAEIVTDPDKTACVHCGKQVAGNCTRCPHCGVTFEVREFNWGYVVILSIALMVLTVINMCIYLYHAL